MLKEKTDEELRKILLTTDGMGKAVKEEALNELLERRYSLNVKDMPVYNYLDGWKS
jgi:hypothetical protein